MTNLTAIFDGIIPDSDDIFSKQGVEKSQYSLTLLNPVKLFGKIADAILLIKF